MTLIWGPPFRISFVRSLRSSQSKVYSGGTAGMAVHAASMLRQRRIILDAVLLRHRRELRRIVVHELFHFAWVRLGNPFRRDWEALLRGEMESHTRGELGWSSEWRKKRLGPEDWRQRTRQWRDYVCESFCDTAAWLLTGRRRHGEFTLGARACAHRMRWFVGLIAARPIRLG